MNLETRINRILAIADEVQGRTSAPAPAPLSVKAKAFRFFSENAYELLMIGSLLDAITTYIAITFMGAWELNPLMAFCFASLGMVPAMVFKMALTSEGGRILFTYAPRALKLLAVGFWIVAAWNTFIIILTIALS